MENLTWHLFGLSPTEYLITAYPFYVLGMLFAGIFNAIHESLFKIYNKYGIVYIRRD